MANGDPIECDLACQTKIIINGGNAANLIEQTCEAFQAYISAGGKLKHGPELIAKLNVLENGAVELQKFFLRECVGYKGEVGELLK